MTINMQRAKVSPYAVPGMRHSDLPAWRRVMTVPQSDGQMRKVMGIVCGFYELKESQFLSRKRDPLFVLARKVFALLCYRYFRISCTVVAGFLSKDHTTVLFYAKNLEGLIETDSGLALEFQSISAKLF